MSALAAPTTRQGLIALLTEACELEHGLACSYLFAAFSLKQRPEEGGLDAEQARLAKFWASQIFFIAGQEMLHLAQAWNLLSAIGGAPYALRPNLPQKSRYYPLHAPIMLEPFGEKALERFIVYETPSQTAHPALAAKARLSADEVAHGHVSIGELYGAIADGFRSIGGLFVGDGEVQADRRLVQFTDLVPVRDTASALQAIAMITDEGEGVRADRTDCHFGMFRAVLDAFRVETTRGGAAFQPVRPVMSNPVADTRAGYGAAAHPITAPLTRETAELFDAVYALMLRALVFAFGPAGGAGEAHRAAQVALELMTSVIRPLGDALTCLPSGTANLNAGPGFGLRRFVGAPADPPTAVRVLGEDLREAAADARRLAAALPAQPQLAVAAARLADIAARLSS